MNTENNGTTVGSAFDQSLARIAVGAYDDAQEVRKSMLNRVRDIIRKKNEGIPFDQVEEEKDDQDYDEKYKDDNLADLIESMRNEDALSQREFEYLQEMLQAGESAASVEERYKSVMEITLGEPIYEKWLDNVYGVSFTLTARLLHRFGYCEDFDRVSQLWSYSGLAPGQERKKGETLGYDPQAKTLAWLVADRIIMQGSRSRYKEEFYDPYKDIQIFRLKRDTDGKCVKCAMRPQMDDGDVCSVCDSDGEPNPSAPESRGHADNRARRYLAKKFLKHYWAIARDSKGLDTPDEWVITHGGHEKRTDTFENPFHARRELSKP